jgi:phytoene synthase
MSELGASTHASHNGIADAVMQKAAGSSFYSAMRLMPKMQREAMLAIYAFCRAVDDIADDGVGSRAERQIALNAWRTDIKELCAGKPTARTAFLADATTTFGLRREDFEAVIDGMEMDVEQDIRAPSLATLDLYCERVASAVGRLSIKVFRMEEGPGFALAYHLGRALQLTNILRDIDEDAAMGRLYLPKEHLTASGIQSDDPAEVIADHRIDSVCRKVAALAHQRYSDADRVLRAHPKGHIRAPKLMGAVYGQILREMERAGWAPPRRRVKLGKGTLLRIVVTAGLLG